MTRAHVLASTAALAAAGIFGACSKPAPPTTPPGADAHLAASPPDAAPERPPPGVRGTLKAVGISEDEDVVLDGRPIHFIREGTGGDKGVPRDALAVIATYCLEKEYPGFNLKVDFYPRERASDDFHVILFSLGTKTPKVGEQLDVATDNAHLDRPRGMAWFARGGGRYPDSGWIRVDEWTAPAGPLDVSFALEYGASGRAEGRIRAEQLHEIVCLSPAPPPPPPK